jgi:hypothetical protein
MKRFAFALIATIAMLLPAGSPVQAASCNGASHAITLTSGGANPGSGTTSTPIAFSVVYADSAGCVPSSVTVQVTGVGTFALTASGANYAAGVRFSGNLTLSPGSHTYLFAATSGDGNGSKTATLTVVSPAAVVISAPGPAPAPIPAPVPQPAPVPPPVVPAPVPPPAPPATDPPATDPPSPSATSSGNESPTPPTTNDPSPTGPSPTQTNPLGPLEADRGLASISGSRSGAPGSGILGSELPFLGTLVAYISATGAGLFFFAILVRRRRDTEQAPVGMTLASVMTSPAAVSSERRVTPLPPMRDLIPPVNPNLLSEDDERAEVIPGEADLPRWLRPSVRAGRQTRDSRRLRGWED